jgi:hypothetical protein
MPRLLTQTTKLLKEEAAVAAHKQVWPFINNVPSRELYT